MIHHHRYPPRGEPMVFVLTSKKQKPKFVRARHKGIGRRYVERVCRWRREERRERRRRKREWSGYVNEGEREESSEEESVA